MKKSFLIDPESSVDEYMASLLSINKYVMKLPGQRVILRKDLERVRGKVAILSGGGAGHEPAHFGYVGRGMLTGGISGPIFTSPPALSVYAALSAVNKFCPSGIILIVTNYTGDKLNFGLARDWAKRDGIKVELVLVDEDCAVVPGNRTGRRGLAGTVLVHKIGGALAEAGKSMDEILLVLKKVIGNMGTVGVCLHPCVLPGSKESTFDVKGDEMELGLGIHGEKGIMKLKMQSCSTTVKMMISLMKESFSKTGLHINQKDEIILLLNNLGGTSVLEMGVVGNEVINVLNSEGWAVKKFYSGSFMTSLQMVGFSITVLKLVDLSLEKVSMIDLLEADAFVLSPLESSRYPNGFNFDASMLDDSENHIFRPTTQSKTCVLSSNEAKILQKCIETSCTQLLAIKEQLNEYDRESGDGDCGTTNSSGARALLEALEGMSDFTNISNILQKAAFICSQKMGGSSGAMYSLFLTSVAIELLESHVVTLGSFVKAFDEGIRTIERYGGAKPGDRTMLDVLKPVSDLLLSFKHPGLKNLSAEVKKVAIEAAQNTITMKPKAGRSSLVRDMKHQFPDPGAFAVAQIISSCAKVFNGE